MDEFRLLGPLEVVVDGKPVSLGGEKPRALLAFLLLERNRTVPTERLVDALWGERPPAQATKTLQVYVSQLRKALGAERVVTRAPGYELRVADGELDLDRFESLAAQARELLRTGDARAGSETLREALGLWRGAPLREFRAEPFAEPAGAALEEQRLAALEDRLQADLDSGATAEAVPELEGLVAAAPLRERPRALLMLALYRSGRQADALELFRRTRELFVEELGLEPGPELRELEAAMLRQDSDLQAPRPRPAVERAPAGPPARMPLRGWAIAAAALVAVSAAVGVAFAVRGSDGGAEAPPPTIARPAGERVFVFRLENFLTQSHAGRNDVRRAVDAALNCRLSRRAALAQLNRVQRNRQSLLEQLAALNVPDGEASLRAADLFQKATLASITADWAYRDWLEARPECAPGTRPPARVRVLDARATDLKRRFVAAFDPLAKRYGQRVWRTDEF